MLIFSCTRRERSGNSRNSSNKIRTEREAQQRRNNGSRKPKKEITEKKDSETSDDETQLIPLQPKPYLPSKDIKFTGKEIFEKYNSAAFIVQHQTTCPENKDPAFL